MRSRGLEVSLQTNFPGEIDRLDHRLHGFVGTLPLIVVGYDVLVEKVFEYFPEMNFFHRLLKKCFCANGGGPFQEGLLDSFPAVDDGSFGVLSVGMKRFDGGDAVHGGKGLAHENEIELFFLYRN
ncbi:MAG: hypothetical protein VCF07_08645 [Nitrospinota bacterium]